MLNEEPNGLALCWGGEGSRPLEGDGEKGKGEREERKEGKERGRREREEGEKRERERERRRTFGLSNPPSVITSHHGSRKEVVRPSA